MDTSMCEHCREVVNYTILERTDNMEIENKNINYKEEYAVCNMCNKEIYIGMLHDKNLEKINKEFES